METGTHGTDGTSGAASMSGGGDGQSPQPRTQDDNATGHDGEPGVEVEVGEVGQGEVASVCYPPPAPYAARFADLPRQQRDFAADHSGVIHLNSPRRPRPSGRGRMGPWSGAAKRRSSSVSVVTCAFGSCQWWRLG
ncbi:hypothetical protein [Streptomyces sp. NPDC001970]